MYYFASLNQNYVCDNVIEIDDQTYNENVAEGVEYESEFSIRISSYDTSLINRKKYINGEWVDALPSETNLQRDTQLVHMPDDKFLNEAIGDLTTLKTTSKTSLVAAINELYDMIHQ